MICPICLLDLNEHANDLGRHILHHHLKATNQFATKICPICKETLSNVYYHIHDKHHGLEPIEYAHAIALGIDPAQPT